MRVKGVRRVYVYRGSVASLGFAGLGGFKVYASRFWGVGSRGLIDSLLKASVPYLEYLFLGVGACSILLSRISEPESKPIWDCFISGPQCGVRALFWAQRPTVSRERRSCKP